MATAGWDYTTGFGTAQVDGLICDIDGLGSGRFAAGVPGACSPDGQPALTGTGGGPGTDVPESPYAVLLLLAGLGAAGVALHRRRQLTD